MNSADCRRPALCTSRPSGTGARAWGRLLLPLLLLAIGAGRLAAADPSVPLPGILDRADPRAKISSLIRPYLDLPPAPQGLDHRLRALMVPASRVDRLKVRLDVPVTPANLTTSPAPGRL